MRNRAIIVVILLVVFLGAIFVFNNAVFSDRKLHLVFCDVGQGDGIFIRTPKNQDILIDGGPDSKILDCLKSHTPFWDKKLELVVLTHPHADHLNGLIHVLKNYKVESFATVELQNETSGFKRLLETLKEQNIDVRYLYVGDAFRFGDRVRLQILGPSREFIGRTSPGGFIGEKNEFANIETLIVFNNFSAFLTGDSQASQLKEAIPAFNLANISVLQVPHHGSKTGLDEEIVTRLSPKLAVISVGKNRYGHPSPSIIRILRDRDIKILRTDKDGNIEIVSDGKEWFVQR